MDVTIYNLDNQYYHTIMEWINKNGKDIKGRELKCDISAADTKDLRSVHFPFIEFIGGDGDVLMLGFNFSCLTIDRNDYSEIKVC